MTKQEYYDLLVRSASDGTFPSGDKHGCYYRLDETATCPQRCAVGLLIDDKDYTPDLEGPSVEKMDDWQQEFIQLPDGLTYEDLNSIQSTHDVRIAIWDAQNFISSLNKLPCFRDIKQVEV